MAQSAFTLTTVQARALASSRLFMGSFHVLLVLIA
jgi:hypothetical protein